MTQHSILNKDKPLVISYLRWSSGKQRLGDSERRQMEIASGWLEKNGYEIDYDRILRDDGKSGYHAENFGENGALGKFIRQVKEGEIPRGTVLIIEDFSRFSRSKVRKALSRFLDLLEAGIRIYVAKDDMEFNEDNADELKIMISLVKMASAYEESHRKSNHLKSVWADKRKKAYENKDIDEYPLLLPTNAPDWIKKVKRGSQKYLEIIPERVEVIKYIFHLADKGGQDGLGLGSSIIVRKLEQEGIKPFKGERRNSAITFTDSYVVRLLKDRRLLGYFQPHKNPIDPDTGKRKRIKDGDEIPNYFPPVIDQETFDRVREKIEQRKLYSSGKVSRKFSNIFTKIVKCAKCGNSMTMFTKRGAKAEGGRSVYLQCSEGTKHRKCGNKAVRYYDTFEMTIIHTISELDLSQIFSTDTKQQDNLLHSLREQAYELTRKIEKLDETIVNASQMCFENPKDQFFKQARIKVIDEQSELKSQLEEINRQILESRGQKNYDDFKNNLQAVLKSQNLSDDIETYTMRKAINTYLIDIFQYIAIDGVKKKAWVVLDHSFFKRLLEQQHEGFQESANQAMQSGNFEEFFPSGPIYDENGVDISGIDNHTLEPFTETNVKELNSFQLGDTPYIEVRLKRFKDSEPTYDELLALRTGHRFAPSELVEINEICNSAINRNWQKNKRINYQVLDFDELDELKLEVAQKFYSHLI